MSIEGRIAVDASFSDLTTGTNSQSLKRMAVTSTDAYSTGKVALVTGTCGTAAVTISLAPSAYIDASGSAVSFTSVSRYAFACSAPAHVAESPGFLRLFSNGSRVAVGDAYNTAASSVYLTPTFTSGTASYSLVIVGT